MLISNASSNVMAPCIHLYIYILYLLFSNLPGVVYKTAADLQMALLTILSKSLTLFKHSMVASYQVYHNKANFKKNKTEHLDIDCLKHSEEFTSLSTVWIDFLIIYFEIVLNI